MSDALYWTDVILPVAAIFVSIVSVVIAFLARSDSKKSSLEAASAKKIAKNDLLKPHFDQVTYLWEIIFNKVAREEMKVSMAQESADALKVSLCKDKKLTEILDQMLKIAEQIPNSTLESYSRLGGNPPSYQTPNKAVSLKEWFEHKRREHLSIE